jgi:KUP system potassium uptake protein
MNSKGRGRSLLVLGALGVVYGDIGTSPLYALRECFHAEHGVPPSPANVMGVLSLVFWSLVLIVCVKYLTFVLRAENDGEGGILSLLALGFGRGPSTSRRSTVFLLMGVFGAALLFGDGMLTPCITILGAVEGLEVATPLFRPYIVPLAIIILVGLFAFQKHGTGAVGRVFGPITLLWFLSIGVVGVVSVAKSPVVLIAINPWYAAQFVMGNGFAAFIVLGAVFLVVTGAEALYADLGHFGAHPIRTAWFAVVFPSLVLNYFGQGALLLRDPSAAVNPFFRLVPDWGLYPLVALATAASIIASQALITGVFSITMQAIQLGYLPRMEIRHTSSEERGQIYMPLVNWLLLLCCILTVIGFGSSSRLSSAYGIAVSLTMLITTILFYFAARKQWNWSFAKAGGLCAAFMAIELVFFAANAMKITHGGWFTLAVGIALFAIMTTWQRGRGLLGQRLSASSLPFDLFLEDLRQTPVTRVKGTAIFMAGNPKGTPLALLHNLKHNQVLHQRVLLLTIATAGTPHVAPDKRLQIESLPEGFYRVVASFGFMERPNIGEVFKACRAQNLAVEPGEATYFLSRETILATRRPGMALWRERLFAFMSRNAQSATAFFDLPANRVVELGMQVEL